MKLSALKKLLSEERNLSLSLPDGTKVPAHFHITEAGLITKHFIDCGGTIRISKVINLQIWVADDVEHRLSPSKLKRIIELAEPLFGNEDLEIEVEYQTETVGKYGLEFSENEYLLTSKKTDCLAQDKCGIFDSGLSSSIPELKTNITANTCKPGGGCC
jgi:hypothetical protein